MKLIRTLKVSEDEFYDYLEDELLDAVFHCNEKQLSRSDIKKGLNYSKDMDNANARQDISILEYERGHCYKSLLTSLTDRITLTYMSEPVKDGLQITFYQDIDSFEQKRAKQNKIFRAFSEGIYLGRMSDTLQNIQKKILKKKEETV